MGLSAIGKEYIPAQWDDLTELYEELKDPAENKDYTKMACSDNEEQQGATFIRAFVMYTIGMILCPTTQRHVSSSYLGLVADISRIGSINFALLTQNNLISSIRKLKARAANLEGNLPLLQVEPQSDYIVVYLKLSICLLIIFLFCCSCGCGRRCMYISSTQQLITFPMGSP